MKKTDIEEVKTNICRTAANDFINAWNALGHPFAKIANWNDKRAREFKARMADEFFATNWDSALERMKASKFCRGEVTNWIAGVEFFLRPGSVEKILEGKYDDRINRASNQGTKPGYHPEGQNNEFAALAARAIEVGPCPDQGES